MKFGNLTCGDDKIIVYTVDFLHHIKKLQMEIAHPFNNQFTNTEIAALE